MNSIQNLFSLAGKTAIVTGANTGLGQGICVALAAAGAHVFGVARRSCEETLNKVNEVGGQFTEVIADLSDLSAIEKIMTEVKSKTERIDILVNNAGIINRADAIDVTVAEWDQVIDLNQKLVFFLSQAVAKDWIADQKGGKIINICSMLSYQGGIRVPAYTTSKSGVAGLTRALANQWAIHNINVNAIAPGFILTDQNRSLLTNPDGSLTPRAQTIISHTPFGRFLEPEELLGTLHWLASDASKAVTGTVAVVDGGFDAFSI